MSEFSLELDFIDNVAMHPGMIWKQIQHHIRYRIAGITTGCPAILNLVKCEIGTETYRFV